MGHLAKQRLMAAAFFGEALEGVSNTKPSGHGVTALHPAKNPGDGSKVVEAAPFTSARRTGAEAGSIQFIYGSGLFEILENFRIVSDVLSIKLVGIAGHFFHRILPVRLWGWARIAECVGPPPRPTVPPRP